MKAQIRSSMVRLLAIMLAGFAVIAVVPTFSAIKNMAVVAAAGSKLPDMSLAELGKLCKGSQKAWPDGRKFTLVLRDPTSPEMHVPMMKLLGTAGADVKPAIAKLNENREVIKIVDTEEDVFRAVGATPGSIGLVDVYSINSSVKVLKVDGKLPFDVGYALK